MPNYYDDDETPESMHDQSSQSTSDAGDMENEKTSSGDQTFLVPNDALGSGLKPGRKCVIEIMRVFEDESECRYVEEEDEDEHEEKPVKAMDRAMNSMNEMASSNPGGGY